MHTVLGPGTLIGEIKPVHPRQPPHHIGALPHASPHRHHHLRAVQRALFPNPQFGFALLRLIVARLHGNAEVRREGGVAGAELELIFSQGAVNTVCPIWPKVSRNYDRHFRTL
jgi:hypothetical protein